LTVVVTGLGSVSSLGRDTATFVRRLLAGDCAIRPASAEERAGTPAEQVARIDAWSPQPEINAMKARRLDRGSQFAVVASLEAVRQSGFPVEERADRVGIALGTGSAGSGALTEFIRVLLTESPEAAPPFHFPNTIANAPASQVSIELKFLGPNVTITQKDPSALNAVIYSVGAIEDGRVEAMLAGGIDEWNALYSLAMDRMHALRGLRRSSGIVQGEGCYVLFLEDEKVARARGARVLARVAGYAFAGAPCPPYAYAEDESAAERGIREALGRAAVGASDVDLVMLSRNGRREMDAMEQRVVSRLFGSRPAAIAVKDAIGEMAAAGGAERVAAVAAIAAGSATTALVHSFGAGGNFLSVVLVAP
jgi:3-oxoacyl-[acyl-carrier-protein] synthase II